MEMTMKEVEMKLLKVEMKFSIIICLGGIFNLEKLKVGRLCAAVVIIYRSPI
jgi:hypothetical protein